jgi:hypothetical protein
MSGGHNKKPILWGGCYFESRDEFISYHGLKSKGSIYYYQVWGKKFRGFEIVYLK